MSTDPKVNIDLQAIAKAVDAAAIEGLNAVQVLFSSTVKKVLSQPGTGRIYRIGVGKKNGRNLRARGFHRASAPGRAPAVDTHRLRASWLIASGTITPGQSQRWKYGYLTASRTPDRVVLVYGSSVVYARRLELGGGRIAARPYLAPSMRIVVPKTEAVMAKAMRRYLGGAA
jgi:hypothetical protein